MSFVIFTDGCSNLPGSLLRSLDIRTLPCTYTLDGMSQTYSGDIEHFDAKAYYDGLRAGKTVVTSLLNTQLFLDRFRPALTDGMDVLYVGMSSGISGTYQAACIAARELMDEFPERRVCTVDSMGAGLGTGLLTCRGAELRAQGLTVEETAARLDDERMNLCEFFTVESLHYLRNTGRISAAVAAVGTMLNIKPLLRGDESGHIVSCGKYRGRRRAVDAIVDRYAEKAVNPQSQRIAISHGDCLEEAQALAERVTAIAKPKELIICPHEPFTGAHVGPGMLALFFFGNGR